jgi:hypothetical protein
MGHGFDISNKDQKYEGFSISQGFAYHADVPDGAVHLSQGTFDTMKFMLSEKLSAMNGKPAASGDGPTVENYGSIASMELPNGFKAGQLTGDASVNANRGPRVFDNAAKDRIGLYNSELNPAYRTSEAKSVMDRPPHAITNDDEFFKVSELITPGGPWSPGGQGHEIGLRTENISGKKALVYDLWRTADPSTDSFDAKMGPNDIRTRVVFMPNETTGKMDVMWFEAKASDFDKAAQRFDQSLKSIRWK